MLSAGYKAVTTVRFGILQGIPSFIIYCWKNWLSIILFKKKWLLVTSEFLKTKCSCFMARNKLS